MSDEVPDRLFIIIQLFILAIVAFLIGFLVGCEAGIAKEVEQPLKRQLEPNYNDLIIINGNSLVGLGGYSPYEIKYKDLIACLISCESNGNPKAVGDNKKAYGILQFHRPTFDGYAKKYKLNLDYKNPDDQILLCDYMLRDDFSNIRHWSCKKKCLKL